MEDKEPLITCYKEMYRCMIAKDIDGLSRVLDDNFVLTHMTGMRQSKKAFLRAVGDGTLNYYSVQHESIEVRMENHSAVLLGQSHVSAAVFGCGRGAWRLQLRMNLIKSTQGWHIADAIASTY